MTPVSQFYGPGYFCVLSQPKLPEYTDEYNEWYNSEHGPLRLKLDFFLNGYRYKSIGVDPPEYLACYDLKKISGMHEPQYTSLRANRSEREAAILSHKLNFLDRRIYSDLSSRGRNGGPSPVILVVTFVVKNEHVDELHRWYEEVSLGFLVHRAGIEDLQEHIDDLSCIPGWRRSRRFQLVEADSQKDGCVELLAVHDFEKENGLDGPEHAQAKSRPWRNKVVNLVESRHNRRFEFLHSFDASDYRTPPLTNGVKASATGATSWQLEGPEDGPVVVFSNSLLTDLHIWNDVITELSILYPDFRFLRYNTRGYEQPSDVSITVDLLTDDLALLLDDLGIRKCFAVIGVSLGGITTLNFAIKYPSRLERFAACDCNAVSTEKNTQAWQDRVSLASTEGGWEKLADQTVKRWFTPKSVEAQTASTKRVKKMILAACKEGFENCAGALCDFDLRQKLNRVDVPGICLVGAADGVLPKTMAEFSKLITASSMVEVQDAGHLPMVENPGAFVQAILPIFEVKITNKSDI